MVDRHLPGIAQNNHRFPFVFLIDRVVLIGKAHMPVLAHYAFVEWLDLIGQGRQGLQRLGFLRQQILRPPQRRAVPAFVGEACDSSRPCQVSPCAS